MMRTDTVALLWRDARNYAQAQLAVRIPGIDCPSLFGHYGVNSTCSLRCSYCYVHEPYARRSLDPRALDKTSRELSQRVLHRLRQATLPPACLQAA
jgi:sulfatase maturation enzyme AslB (radical SAM superfamily)